MTALLYYSISSHLTEDEKSKIDKRVTKNREGVYLFVRNLPSNSKRKAKRLVLYIVFLFAISQPLIPCAVAVVMPLPPVGIHRLSPMEQDRILSNKNSYPQIAHILEEKVDKVVLTNSQIKELDIIFGKYCNGSLNLEETILEIRAGGFYDWATLGFIIAMFMLQQGDSFQSVPLPHMDPLGWATGKYDSRNSGQCRPKLVSQFDHEVHRMKQMCTDSRDENGFVMSYKEAKRLVYETYPGYIEIDENCKISDWQAAKHMYHAKGMGVDISKYDFTQQQLEKIREGGLIAYARRGYKLPPIEMVQDYQSELKKNCDKAPIKKSNVPYYDCNGSWKSTVFAIPRTESSSAIIIAFNESTGDLITGDKQRPSTFNRFESENYLGAKKHIIRWSGK